MIIDAKDLIVGRIATVAAKKALLGEKVEIVNCEQAVITGKRRFLLDETKRRLDMGIHAQGPFMSRMPDRYVKRIIRGMLPYKQEKGRNAFKRILIHIGMPKELEGQKIISIKDAHVSKTKDLDYMTVKEICQRLGAKI
jgi:large subunit ribosomal protein L13